MKSSQNCSIEGCIRPRSARGWCNTHYERWRLTGSVILAPWPTLEERFWAKVDSYGICWEWTGAMSDTGYGSFFRGKALGNTGAHRAAWEILVGPIPAGLVLDHLCRNRKCVNPDHLEPVTERVNLMRGVAPTWRATVSDICQRGHTLKDAYKAHRADGRVTRVCRTCTQARVARYALEAEEVSA